MSTLEIALTGNPNCGKTTLFNALTGAHQRVGNWPGVTVDKKTGHYTFQKQRIDVVDLPGTYAIESISTGVSQDELVVRNFVLSEEDNLIVNVVDATNLQRNLYLTFQLLDLNRPMIVVLNMIDEVRNIGEKINTELLEKQLGCPVVAVSASRGEGIEKLKEYILSAVQKSEKPATSISTLGIKTENVLQQCLSVLPEDSKLRTISRWKLFDLLMQNADSRLLNDLEVQQLNQFRAEFAEPFHGEVDIALASARYDSIDKLCQEIIERPREAGKSLTAALDKLALGRWAGIPVFLIAMYLMFLLAIKVGSVFIDFFDGLFGTLLVDGSNYLLSNAGAPDWLIALISNGLGGGIQTVSTFIPVIAAMFLCLSFLEDSGYLARAAMIVDRGMRSIGLPGKAFVPMLMGFGCGVPAIMGTRTLESSRDRIISIMMIPFMSCGARLPVYALMVAVFFPKNGQNVVFALYLFGIFIAVLTGLALKHSLLPGKATPFIMELPPYRMPTIRNLLLLTWERLKSFIIRAGKAIVLMVTVLSFFNSLGTDGSFGNEDSNKSVLSNVGKAITPVFYPMGIQDENWPATVGLFTGIFAKEAVIGTLNSLYAQMDVAADKAENAEGGEDENYDPVSGIKEAFGSIWENIQGLTESITDPLGITGTLADGDVEAVAEEQGVDEGSIGKIHELFGSSAAVIAFLIFVLLYTPCAAALGAVYREAGAKWTIMVAVWTLVVAWVCATGYYQFSLLSTHPGSAGAWLIGMSITLIVLFIILRRFGQANQGALVLPETQHCEHKECC